MENTDVLISGAGIAGSALAFWLRRAGRTVTVVERAPAPRPGGQTVDLRGAGRTVVTRMGLMDRARALSVAQEGFALVDASGRITARVPADAFGGEGIVSEIEILRGDLAELLHDATAPGADPGITHLFDDTVTSLTEHADGVDVTFEKAPPRRFGLVVGADGLHSVVRSLAFGPEREHVRPLDLYTAWFTSTDPDLPDLAGWYLMHNAPGGLVASARPGRLPGEIKASLCFRSPPLALDRRDPDAARRLLAERFAGVDGWQVPRLLRAALDSPDLHLDSMWQVSLDHWTRGRTALLGDAGYCPSPLTGLGTSLALVGAYVLAGELATAGAAPDAHARAFARYEQIMRPYVTQAMELPPGGVSAYAPTGRLGIRLRALSTRTMTRWPMRPLLAAQFAKAETIDLPDYSPLLAPTPVHAKVNADTNAGTP
ncbi:FAD-dependent monooxygenase (plasmid) [Streptomyces sp. BI20]|uniref:FAD-dependent monooxygenase n=1 Tax=Streptomyces sp. BI20 TaxID=3403460 RepID=UPI003C74BCCC